MTYYAYILKCADGTYYTGCTHDLEGRLKEHNHLKKGAHYTKIRRPVELVYQEGFETLKEARAREAKIKRFKREGKEALSLKSM